MVRSIESRDTSKRHKEHASCIVPKSHFLSTQTNNTSTVEKLIQIPNQKYNLNENGKSIHIDLEGRIKVLRMTLDAQNVSGKPESNEEQRQERPLIEVTKQKSIMNENLTQNLNSSETQVNSSSRKADIVQNDSHMLTSQNSSKVESKESQLNFTLESKLKPIKVI